MRAGRSEAVELASRPAVGPWVSVERLARAERLEAVEPLSRQPEARLGLADARARRAAALPQGVDSVQGGPGMAGHRLAPAARLLRSGLPLCRVGPRPAPEGGTTAGGSAGASGGESGAEQSPGCGEEPTLQNGTINITYENASRNYILRLPDGYDNSHPYRLVFAYAESGASASQVASRDYFRMAGYDGSEDTVFVAPDAANGAGSWSNSDVGFTDAILEELENDLCIDTTRIFATGFSFGGGMAMAIACTRADVFRAVAFFSGADLTGSCPSTLTTPIAYYASQASEDANGMDITNPMTGEMKQAQFAAVNGCTAEPNSTNFPGAGQPHTCTIYQNCSSGHPTEYCVFNGPHGWEPVDPGENTSWDPPEAWKFITQF